MTQTKLEIIGPYTPEHEGPFCTRDGRLVKVVSKVDGSKDLPVIGMITDDRTPTCWTNQGRFDVGADEEFTDLMNAREVPVAREFWIGLTANGANVYNSGNAAVSDCLSRGYPISGIIHVREVLPGEE